MNKSKMTRLLAMFLVVVMVMGFAPVSAFAEGTETGEAPIELAADPEQGNAGEDGALEGSEEGALEGSPSVGNVTYTVVHNIYDIEDELLEVRETEVLTGIAGEMTNAQAKNYEGCTLYVEIMQMEIAADGSTVVDVWYLGDLEYVAPVEVTYTVNHSVLDFDADIFVLKETETLVGMPGEMTNAQDKGYDGCILFDDIQQVEIAADGSTVVDVYYIELQEEAAEYAVDPSLYDTKVSNGYYKILETESYSLAPGADEHSIILNNADGSRRQIVHVFELDTKNESLEVMPGYWAIDKLNPDDLAGDSDIWKAEQLTKTVAYYEDMGYNVVGAMNTALQYNINAPYGYMVWDGVVLGTPEISKGAQTYLAIDWEGNCELRSMSTPLTGKEKTAIPANFGWLVKDGVLVTKTPERTTAAASRSMIGIKADGTLIFCQVDGRVAPTAVGLSNYEMGEMMLALGCVNAVNCDGGGSSTFVSQRAGEDSDTMRSIPSDGSERPTINSVIIATTAGKTGELGEVLIKTGYDYIAPGAKMAFEATGIDTHNFTMEIPAEVTYRVAEVGMGSIVDGVFTAGSTTTGTATIQAVYNDKVVGEKQLNVVHPRVFGFTAETTALPMDKTLALELKAIYGEDDWNVCIDGAYTLSLPEENLGSSLKGNVMSPPADPAQEMKSVIVTVTYNPDPTNMKDTISVMFGEASKVIIDFEDGDRAGFMGFEEAKQWSIDNGVNNSLVGSDPLAGQFNEYLSSQTKIVSEKEGGQVRNGNYALAWTLDNTDTNFANWSYNVLFNVGEKIVFRDTANGKNATSLGMWLYIPEGAAGLAFQSQFWNGSACKQDHFTFRTVNGTVKNLNSCTEADIPANRWVYASINLTAYDYLSTMDPSTTASNSRSPSFIRTYVKPNNPGVHTFYIDDITLDYSSAVDDRVAPVIGEIKYTLADEAKPVEGVTITADTATFSAEVSDNTSLDAATAKIYIDGNEVTAQVQGKFMSSAENVTMDNGSHVVTFEISDKMGNEFQTSSRFTVNSAEATHEKGLVYVTGHNDSGAPAESGSVYYVDIKTSDIEQIDNVEFNIKLNNANTWELDHAVVAEGFSADCEVLSLDNRYQTFALTSDIHSTDNVAVITIKKTDDCSLTGEQTLISLPVRLWSWDGYDYVNNKPIDPLDNKPIVTIDYNVLFGCAETVSGDYVSFGGSDSVTTKMDNNKAVLHVHDAELTALPDKAATCTTNGYTGRTYCETCKSVVDWGTKLEAGHVFEIVDNQLVCHCGKILDGNGLVTANDKIYVLIADKLVTGWQNVEGSWVYADASTKEVQTGEFTVNKLTYTADEYGFVVKGAWVTDSKGTKYSFGPAFYNREWADIDGKTYYFHTDSYMFTGTRSLPVNRNNMSEGVKWYNFAEDGVFLGEATDLNGIVEENGMKYYVVNGWNNYGGLLLIDGDYYYARTSGEIVCGKAYWISKNNDLLPVASYTFDADGKMVNPPVTEEPEQPDVPEQPEEPEVPTVKNGIVSEGGKLWWYVNDVKTYGGLMLIDGDYYYARSSGEILANTSYWITKNNDLLPAASYKFGADGKMINPPVTEEPEQPDVPEQPEEPEVPAVKNGIVSEGGKLWWYVNDVKTYGGLMLIDGDYYYARSSGEILTNISYWITKNNDLLPAASYKFGADGKMINPPAAEEPEQPDVPEQPEEPEVPTVKNGIVSEGGKLWWYVNDVKTYGGLMLIDGDYYYARTSGEILANTSYWISKTNDLLPAANYKFGADGKMLNPPTA